MKRDIAIRWAEALESDRFKQGRGALCIDLGPGVREHCCLGVLCELAIEDGIPVQVDRLGRSLRFDKAEFVLPASVMNWADLHDSNPKLDGQVASVWNDSCGATFPEIAALIRKQFVDVEVSK